MSELCGTGFGVEQFGISDDFGCTVDKLKPRLEASGLIDEADEQGK